MTLIGYGRSGYGSYGYTTSASLTDRRVGFNEIDGLQAESGGDGLLFRYDLDAPATTGQPGGSLGNALETVIGLGESGGPILVPWADGHALVGVNTFTEGYGGRRRRFPSGSVDRVREGPRPRGPRRARPAEVIFDTPRDRGL